MKSEKQGAYIAFKPGVRELLDGICGLRGETRTSYIINLVENSIATTYNNMPNRDAVLLAQQTIAQTRPPLTELYEQLLERVFPDMVNVDATREPEEEPLETY
jgi:hypothetical protein